MAQAKILQRCLRLYPYVSWRTECILKSSLKNITVINSARFSISHPSILCKVVTEPLPIRENSNDGDQPRSLRRRIEDRIRKTTDIESLLSLVDSGKKITSQSATAILSKACILAKKADSSIDMNKLSSDDRIESLGVILDNQVLNLPTGVLVSALGCFLELYPTDTKIVESLERQVTWLLPKMTAGQLTSVINVHQDHQETELRKKNYLTAKELIEKRWVEIASGSDVVALMYYFGQESEAMMQHLEDRALDLSESMTAKELYHVLYILSKKGKRNAPLLRALVYHINRQKLGLSFVQLMNLVYACARLNVYDTTLLDKIGMELLNNSSKFDDRHLSIMTSLVRSFSSLRLRNPLLLDMFSLYFIRHQERLSTENICSFLLTCSNVNYTTPDARRMFLDVVDKIERDGNPRLWLDVVWSLAVLGEVESRFLETALQPQFYETITGHEEPAMSVKSRRQLLNLNGVARHEAIDYSGPFLSDEFIISSLDLIPERKEKEIVKLAVKTAENFAPSPKFMTTAVKVQSGHIIDLELLVNSDGQPQPLDTTPLDSLHRVAVLVLDFANLTLHGDNVPNGRSALAARQLKQMGYKVVEVPHYEISEQRTVVEQVQYLQKKIKDALV